MTRQKGSKLFDVAEGVILPGAGNVAVLAGDYIMGKDWERRKGWSRKLIGRKV